MTATLVLDMLFETALRSAVIAAMVAVALSAFRIRSAAVRHAAWTGVLAAMLLLPAASTWLPTVPLPEWVPAGSQMGWVTEWTTTARTDTPSGAAGSLNAIEVPAVPAAPVTRAATSDPVRITPEPASDASSSLSVRGWIVFIWIVGASILLLREAAGWWMARRLARQSVRFDGADDAGALYHSDRVTTPVVAGVWAPRVLVPDSWPRWGVAVRRMVVLHERAHITRRDPLVAAAARVNRSLFWFHPLAWWLEGHLNRVAERACDEAVVRQVQDPRHYAGLLVEMARRLQKHGHRVAWQGIGIVSSRHFEDRINGVLKGPVSQPSRLVKVGTGVVCALLIGIGAACERQTLALAPDPEVTASMAAEAKRMEAYQAAIAMTPDQVAALERKVAANPEDLDATRGLLSFYQAKGQQVMGWDAMVAARRPHLLRLIQYQPESVNTWPLPRHLDPVGYDAASALWAAHVKPADISPKLLRAAVRFYEISEPFVAERLLLRAHDLNPSGPPSGIAGPVNDRSWLDYLGNLYGKAVVAEKPGDPRFAERARRQLAETTRAEILVGAGNHLTLTADWRSQGDSQRAQGLAYLERAVQLDPAGPRTQQGLNAARNRLAYKEENERARLLFGTMPHQVEAAAFDNLSDELRLEYSHELLWGPHAKAMGAYTRSDTPTVEASLAEFRRRADVMAQMAKGSSVAPDAAARLAADVHVAMGTYAMRQGNRAEALKRLQQAAEVGAVPAPEITGHESALANSQATKLTHELLDAGEREPVAAFYDVVARTLDGDPGRKADFEKAAAAIRAGTMPFAYQYYLARQYNAKNAKNLKISK